jgi:hypothetical protein
MSTNVPGPDAHASASSPDSPTPIVASSPRPGRTRAIALAAGVVAALLSWGAGEAAVGGFQPKRAAPAANPMLVQFENAELDRIEVNNAALAYGLQGAILGLVLGLAGASARGSARAAASAGLTGLVLGGALGAGAAWGAFTAFFRLAGPNRDDLLPALLAHAGAWAPIGAAAGLAFGLGLGGRARITLALVGGLLGAAAGALIYEVAGSIAFPLGKTAEPVASTIAARLFAQTAVNLLTALGAAFFAETAGSPPPPKIAADR